MWYFISMGGWHARCPFFIKELMPTALFIDLRERVLNDYDAGMPSENVARKYSVSIAFVFGGEVLVAVLIPLFFALEM